MKLTFLRSHAPVLEKVISNTIPENNMPRMLSRPLLQAALFVILPTLASAYEVKPVSEAQAAEYKLDPSFYKKGILVQDILIATSQQGGYARERSFSR